MTKVLTKTQKVYNALSTGKVVKLDTLAKKLYGNTEESSKNNTRRFINHLKDTSDLKIRLVAEGAYQAK